MYMYRICSIGSHGYNLFHGKICACGYHLRAVTKRERFAFSLVPPPLLQYYYARMEDQRLRVGGAVACI